MNGVTVMAEPVSRPDVSAGLNVVFFDGVCVLCHRSMRFLLRRNRRGALHFAPLQGETFAALTDSITLEPGLDGGLDSIVYVRGHDADDPDVFVRSDAWLAILRDLGGIWSIASWARAVPRFLRDPVYDWIARNRYRWFGRYDECRLPTPPEQDYLLP